MPSSAGILDPLSDHEKKLILSGLSGPEPTKPTEYKWTKSSFKFATTGDWHTGHKKSFQAWHDRMCSRIEAEKCEFLLHTGDITEGMSGRPGHVYELDAIGAGAQVKLAAQRINQIPCQVKAITGNHDLWGYKALGFDPGADLIPLCKGFEYLGQNEATIRVGGVSIMLSHPGDGSAYAVSYALQQFINALSGGEKPNILLMGHHHKSIFFPHRNIQAFETGTMCAQTDWMRGKKIQAHPGFWIVEVWPSAEGGVERIRHEWIPFFS